MAISFEEIENKDMLVIRTVVANQEAANFENFGHIFTAHRAYEVIEVSEVHKTAGSDASDVGLNIERLSGTESAGNGDEILVTDFDLKGAANTVVFKNGVELQNRQLARGDRLMLKRDGTFTAVNDVCVVIILRPLGRGHYLI